MKELMPNYTFLEELAMGRRVKRQRKHRTEGYRMVHKNQIKLAKL
jgi:hypothetical protein